MGKSTISMVIFNSYVKLPEGIQLETLKNCSCLCCFPNQKIPSALLSVYFLVVVSFLRNSPAATPWGSYVNAVLPSLRLAQRYLPHKRIPPLWQRSTIPNAMPTTIPGTLLGTYQFYQICSDIDLIISICSMCMCIYIYLSIYICVYTILICACINCVHQTL